MAIPLGALRDTLDQIAKLLPGGNLETIGRAINPIQQIGTGLEDASAGRFGNSRDFADLISLYLRTISGGASGVAFDFDRTIAERSFRQLQEINEKTRPTQVNKL